MTFFLDFADGRSRHSYGNNLDAAKADALQAAEATSTSCRLLDEHLRRVGEVRWTPGGWAYEERK